MSAAEFPSVTVSDISDARVIARLDLNVPLSGRAIADDARLHAALPTLRALGFQRNQVLVIAHLGRPRGVQSDLSLGPVAQALSRLLDKDVPLVPTIDKWSRDARRAQTALLENIRFDPRETSQSAAERDEFAMELRADVDLVVSDAFSTFHRRHATIVELVRLGPSAAGKLVDSELKGLAPLRSVPDPLVLIAGGTRAEEKLGLLDGLTAFRTIVLLGAPLAARLIGLAAGDGLEAATAQRILQRENTLVPSDVMVKDETGDLRTLAWPDVHSEMHVMDLGPRACRQFTEIVRSARTVVWNGPPGHQHERAGQRGAKALAVACARSPAITIVGGGTTSMPLRWLGLTDRVTHVSTGGTVLLYMLLGRPIPGIDAMFGGAGL